MKETENIAVIDDFEGSMISKYNIKNDNIFISLKKEKLTIGYKNKKFNYNLHFHFGIYNPSNIKKTINVFIECNNENDLKNSLPRLWLSDDIDKEYKLENNIIGKTNFQGRYYIKINLNKKQKLYIANYPPIRYSSLQKIFDQLSNKSNAKKVSIGKTSEGRDITSYEYGNLKDKPTILFVSGFHPPERDTIAIISIMEKFQEKEWKDRILKKFSFSLLPILNPDGFANSMQGSNINEINFHWKFFGNSKDNCPEAYYVWEYCKKIKPIVFFDFHSFTFQNNTARTYIIPEGYYISNKGKLLQKYLNKKIKKICKNNYSKNEKILAPNLLATRLRNELGTITIPKFHLHMKDGIINSKKMAIECFNAVIDGLLYLNIKSSDDILIKPYGKINTTVFDSFRIKILNFWYFYVAYYLKKLKFI